MFGGEVSAHYYFRDFSQADSGTVPFLLMCELVSRRGKLHEVLAPFRARYFITGEINTPVADVPAKLQELEDRFGADGRSRISTGSRSTRRLALQRAPVEHGAAAAPEPRSELGSADEREARRGARRDPGVAGTERTQHTSSRRRTRSEREADASGESRHEPLAAANSAARPFQARPDAERRYGSVTNDPRAPARSRSSFGPSLTKPSTGVFSRPVPWSDQGFPKCDERSTAER